MLLSIKLLIAKFQFEGCHVHEEEPLKGAYQGIPVIRLDELFQLTLLICSYLNLWKNTIINNKYKD